MLNKLTVKKLIEFNRLSDRSRKTFANQLKTPKTPNQDDSGGGDYWIRSLSGLASAFKFNDNGVVTERIDSLNDAFKTTSNHQTKVMYQRNLEILLDYKSFDFSTLRPSTDLKFLTKSKEPLAIHNMPLQVLPHHAFTYISNDKHMVGGIWFVAWLDKFDLKDLGIFSESMFKHLSQTYSEKFEVDPAYCLTVDALSMQLVSYEQILNGSIPSLLEPSLDTLNSYL